MDRECQMGKDLFDRLDQCLQAAGRYPEIANYVQQIARTGIHNGIGQLASSLHELRALLHDAGKGRKVGRQKYGDVHVGHKYSPYAKTIELKSNTAAYTTKVDQQIKVGLMQLQGLAQTTKNTIQPRPNDVWVLDVLIAHPMGCWPYPSAGHNRREAHTVQKHVAGALERLRHLIAAVKHEPLEDYLGRAAKLPNKGLPDEVNYKITHPGPRSTRPELFGECPDRPGYVGWWKIPALTIKIRYAAGLEYPIIPATVGGDNRLVEMKFQWRGGTAALEHLRSVTTRV